MSAKKEDKMLRIQQAAKAGKDLFNNHGGYRYRSMESINEAVKPILAECGCVMIAHDELVMIGDRYYIKAVVRIYDNGAVIGESVGYARETEQRKGMDASQITGSASSYARKYAANGLLLLDDNKDSDTGYHSAKTAPAPEPEPSLTATQSAYADKIRRWVGDRWPKMQRQIRKRLSEDENGTLAYAWEKYGRDWQRRYIHAAYTESALGEDEYVRILQCVAGVASSTELQTDDYVDEIVRALQKGDRG